MASSIEFVEFVCEQIGGVGVIRHKKMFGEYMVYCNDKPIILICDDTAFVKVLAETTTVLGEGNKQGYPYNGAKLHYVVDVDDKDKMIDLSTMLEKIISLPKKKK